MPLSNYTVGRDVQVDINTAYGVVTIPVVISFDAKPKVNQVDVTKITGETDTLMIPKTGMAPLRPSDRMPLWIRGGRSGNLTISQVSTAPPAPSLKPSQRTMALSLSGAIPACSSTLLTRARSRVIRPFASHSHSRLNAAYR